MSIAKNVTTRIVSLPPSGILINSTSSARYFIMRSEKGSLVSSDVG